MATQEEIKRSFQRKQVIDIYLCLRKIDPEEEEDYLVITEYCNPKFDPFKIGDEIDLVVDHISPLVCLSDDDDCTVEDKKVFISFNKPIEKQFDNKKVKIVEKEIVVKFDFNNLLRIVISYYCKFV